MTKVTSEKLTISNLVAWIPKREVISYPLIRCDFKIRTYLDRPLTKTSTLCDGIVDYR